MPAREPWRDIFQVSFDWMDVLDIIGDEKKDVYFSLSKKERYKLIRTYGGKIGKEMEEKLSSIIEAVFRDVVLKSGVVEALEVKECNSRGAVAV